MQKTTRSDYENKVEELFPAAEKKATARVLQLKKKLQKENTGKNVRELKGGRTRFFTYSESGTRETFIMTKKEGIISIYAVRPGKDQTERKHDFWTEYLHEEMTALKVKAGLVAS